MSLIFLTSHNENIYDVDRSVLRVIEHPERYVAKTQVPKNVQDVREIAPNHKLLASTGRLISSHKTMGYANTPLNNPCDFLRKNEGLKWTREKNHYCSSNIHLPSVPKASEATKLPEKTTTNFKVVNINRVKGAPAYRRNPRYADTRYGATHSLCNSGIMPAYIFSPNFGRIPKYLLNAPKRSAKSIQQDTNEQHDIIEEREGMDLLNTNQRYELLFGLKRNWNELQKKFQSLPVFTDTQAKKLRKAQLENELRQLEQDILLIENNPQIYVCK